MKAENQNLISGFRVAKTAPSISHLQFADDTLIFCEAKEDQIKNVKAILYCFEAVLGLKINFFKSELIGIRVEESLMSHEPICRNFWMQSEIFPGDQSRSSFM